MRLWALVLVWPSCVWAQRELSVSPLVETLRPTPVFEWPSSKSKVLADAPIKTPLLVRAVSSQGTWILVEDEDKHRGWIPVAFTNFESLGFVAPATTGPLPEAGPRQALPNIFEPPPGEEPPAIVLGEAQSPYRGFTSHQVGVVGGVWAEGSLQWEGGAFYDFLPAGLGSRERYGLGLSLLRRPKSWEIPLRFMGRSLSEDGYWSHGPDFELRWSKFEKGSKWNLGLGFAGGLMWSQSLFVRLRAGLVFTEGFEANLGLQMGWNL